MKSRTLFAAAAALAAIFNGRGLAAYEGGMDAGRKEAYRSCTADKETFCKDVRPGGGAVVDCLKDHMAELSSDCRGMMVEKENKDNQHHAKKDVMKACKSDAKQFCRGIKPGEMIRIAYCLGQHDVELSNSCRELMEEGNDWTKPQGIRTDGKEDFDEEERDAARR